MFVASTRDLGVLLIGDDVQVVVRGMNVVDLAHVVWEGRVTTTNQRGKKRGTRNEGGRGKRYAISSPLRVMFIIMMYVPPFKATKSTSRRIARPLGLLSHLHKRISKKTKKEE